MPDIGGSSQKYGGGGVKGGGGGGGGGYQCRVQVPLRLPAKGYGGVLCKLELCELINLITITFHYQLSSACNRYLAALKTLDHSDPCIQLASDRELPQRICA